MFFSEVLSGGPCSSKSWMGIGRTTPTRRVCFSSTLTISIPSGDSAHRRKYDWLIDTGLHPPSNLRDYHYPFSRCVRRNPCHTRRPHRRRRIPPKPSSGSGKCPFRRRVVSWFLLISTGLLRLPKRLRRIRMLSFYPLACGGRP